MSHPRARPSGLEEPSSEESTGAVATPRRALVDPGMLRRARDGDRAAREDLARRSGPVAFRFALHLLGDREQARDVAQESLMRLFASLHRIDPDRPLAPWLLRIVRNRAIDQRRRDRTRAGVENHSPSASPSSSDPVAQAPDREPGPLERTERGELQRLVWTCMGRLDPAHREIIALRDFEDLSYREIAEVLGIPLGTVMSRLHMARRKLRAAVLEAGYRFGGSA